MSRFKFFIIIFITIFVVINIFAKNPVKIKDLASIQGVRENQLMGIGLVTGLQGMGDSKDFKLTKKMLTNLTVNYGFDIKEEEIRSKNVAAVLVTANIGGFARSGDLINITISSVGDAKSLTGGILLQTALKAADGNVYAVAQGRVIAGTKEQSTETSASIPNGAIVEKDIVSTFTDGNKISINLKNPDFTTANLIREAILGLNPNLVINTIDAGLVEVALNEEEQKNPIDFISKLEVLTVTPDNISILIIDKK
ncbi:MAG TPA: flagellar basal body P-ring protein FlgI, partial [Spirochaetota bacterium]|nr:flagellar basal body P-ring protein FlgI [Spirochaetota bacterium]